MMDSAAVHHGVPMDKGTNSSESKMDKSVANEEAPVSFRSYMEALMSNVPHRYTPLTFFYIKGPTVDYPGVNNSFTKKKLDISCENYVPLSSFSTIVFKDGSTDMGNKSSESKTTCKSSESKVSKNYTLTSPPMDKGLSSQSKVSRNSIPDQLALSILSKLPIKSLKRFGCIRKSWSILFENHDFMTMYTNHFISRHGSDHDYHTFLLSSHVDLSLKLYYSELHLLDNSVKFNLPPPFQHSRCSRTILTSTSVNGIFCLAQPDPINLQYVLWNPATEEFRVIPRSPAELSPQHPQNNLYIRHVFHGFGYDQVRDDLKVVQYVAFDYVGYFTKMESYFEIYSLKSNSWRTIDMENTLSYCWYDEAFDAREVYVDGACHWLVSYGNKYIKSTLLSFDLSDEVFLTTPIGEEPDSPCAFEARLAVLNGSIALISNYHDDIVFHIYILGELGVSESWIELYIYGPLSSIRWSPVGFGKMGYIFFQKKDYELAYVDLSTLRIQELGINGGEASYFQVGLYKESFLSIGGSLQGKPSCDWRIK